MKAEPTKTIFGAMAAAVLCLAAVTSVSAQSNPPGKPSAPRPRAASASKALMADQVYKNLKVLHGLTEDQFMDTMV